MLLTAYQRTTEHFHCFQNKLSRADLIDSGGFRKNVSEND